MFKKIIITILLFASLSINANIVNAEEKELSYGKLRVVDLGTFNEYRYKITKEFFNFRNYYEVNGSIGIESSKKIAEYAKEGYNYLPNSLTNQNYYQHLITELQKGVKYPNNESNFSSIATAIENYLDKTRIESIKGKVEAFPDTGNAPLTVTLRGNVKDPTGTKIGRYNYTWWIYENGKRKVIGDNITHTHTFKEEGNFSVFLDVTSSHKNAQGYIDVLSFSSRADIVVKEKIASVIIKVNSDRLGNRDELKYTPDEAKYGLLFDATSSTPTSGAKFIETSWDFGNGIEKIYKGEPKVERVKYAKEGEFRVVLKLKTNELKVVTREFDVVINDPIATISASQEEGYLGDKFTFSAKTTGNDRNLSYEWEIIDLKKDLVTFRKTGTTFTYSFSEKGKYNVKLKTTDASGEDDIDTKIIHINSRSPVADFGSSIPLTNKPNRIFLDATKSFDPDFSDDGKLKYSWLINGNRVVLDKPNFNGSTGYYTFDSIGNHSVVLEVTDPDSISSQKKDKIGINSILSVDFHAFPRVTQRNSSIRFVSDSPEAKFYEWDFGDGETKGGKDSSLSHKYTKSGVYIVKLTVRDSDDNINSFSKNVYIGESESPYSFIGVQDSSRNDVGYKKGVCNGEGAYIINRVGSVAFSGKESIDITGENKGLTYSWKLGKDTYMNSPEFSKKFDELGCFSIRLTVKSESNGKTHSTLINVKVENVKPTLSSLDVRVTDFSTDPVIVNVTALGAKDKDGIIQSFLWYYYTDIDSDPQDFRATKNNSTSFVLPKVTGNYYFVVVMKDNNEERITSEEVTGSKYFMTLTGDNINTPLVKLEINDSSISVGDEVVFTANVENILGQNLNNKVKYSWDFDGDGFYDRETDKNTVTYKFVDSGEKHSKVKVKYKGFSNTRSLTVNVLNILKPDFSYISIGNKFVFFDQSIGTADNYEWDLGDGTIIKSKKSFVHEYTDKKVSHFVNLKISEGTKVKDIELKVVKNVKNQILANKQGLIVFSDHKIVDNNINIENKFDNIYIYLGESKPGVSKYIIDYDLDYDSDLNGGIDDDEDNKNDYSYKDGSGIKVKLNDVKIQTIRVYTKDSDGVIIDSKDLTITKKYIKENEIDINSIVFDGVSESIKFKIEKIKDLVSSLPKEHKLKGLMYVQKLQEEWSDDREKTNVILEFEGFILDTGVDNTDEFIDLLESLLVENQEDKSEKAVVFIALKNLIPTSVECDVEGEDKELTCYSLLISKLELIKNNQNIEENKLLGSEILKVIVDDKVMTNKEKNDFKAILKTFVYGGIDNIPEEEIKEVLADDKEFAGNESLGLFIKIVIGLAILVGGFIGLVLMFYIYYLLVNKDDNIGFQDFIIEKTSGNKVEIKKETPIEDLDILNDIKEVDEKEKIEESKETTIEPVVSMFSQKIEKEKTSKQNETVIENVKESKSDVPEWLKGSSIEEKTEIKETKKEEIKEVKKEDKKEEVKKDTLEKDKKDPETKTEVKEDKGDVPEWLKGSFTEEKAEIKETKKEEKSEKIKENQKEELDKITKIDDDDNIPDWLKGSFSEEPLKKEPEAEKVMEELKEPKHTKEVSDDGAVPDGLQSNEKDKGKKEVKEDKKQEIQSKNLATETNIPQKEKFEVKKEGNNGKNNRRRKKTSKQGLEQKEIVEQEVEKKAISKKSDNKNIAKKIDSGKEQVPSEKKPERTDTPKGTTELWDDGMNVPDWLKTDNEK